MVRIYQTPTLLENSKIELDENAFNHLIRVLRLKMGENITLFDGTNRILPAMICEIDKKKVWVQTQFFVEQNLESPLKIELGQVISRGEKMEFTIQKAVELGVARIVPLVSKRCGVKLDAERMAKKVLQWRKIAQSACEQCGRNQIPEITEVMPLEDWCEQLQMGFKMTLHPRAQLRLSQIQLTEQKEMALLIGSEGGLTDEEIAMTTQHQFKEVQLGQRILRTETAALAVLSALQCLYGDL